MRRFRRWQLAAVAKLELERGQTVLDVACGTGLNFAAIEEAIGPEGRLVGIDLSPEMLAVARRRAEEQRWQNVTLIEGTVESARIDATGDAALFSFTHDVLQSERAVANVVAHLRPGARVASVGAKTTANPLVNFFVRRAARPYVTTFEGLERPWRHLERYGELEWRPLALGGAHLAWGRIAEDAPARAARLAAG